MTHILDLSDCFLIIGIWMDLFLASILHGWCCVLPSHHIWRCKMSVCPLIGNAQCDHLVKVVSARLLYYRGDSSPLWFITNLCEYLVLQNLPPNCCRIHWWSLLESVITGRVAKCWFSMAHILLRRRDVPFIFSYLKISLSFPLFRPFSCFSN